MRCKFSFFTLIITSFLLTGSLITSCGKKTTNGLIIITLADNNGKLNITEADSLRYTKQSHLMAIDYNKTAKSAEILTKDFYSARSPEVSYDGKSIIFSAQKNENDNWHIWEMKLNNKKYKQVTSGNYDSFDPAYLPNGNIIFSRYLVNDSLRGENSLFTCKLEGTDVKRISFNPHTYAASSVLNDGRIITLSRQVFPSRGKVSLMVLRPDGTKSELFYKGSDGSSILSKGRETDNGRIVFIESEKNSSNGGSVVSVSYNRPLHSRINLTSTIPGEFHSVVPFSQSSYLVTYRSNYTDNLSLYIFDQENRTLGDQVYQNTDYDVLDALPVRQHERQKKLPSEVDTDVKTGLLLCQNISVTGMQSPEGEFPDQSASRVEIIGIDSSLGVINVEKDGSFYLKVASDMPFTIKTLDSNGNIIHGPGSWIWLRPNERRGCTGCHEDNEMVPSNRLALAVKKEPVSVPVNISGIVEKKVELE